MSPTKHPHPTKPASSDTSAGNADAPASAAGHDGKSDSQAARRLKYGLNVAVLLLSLALVLGLVSWLTATANVRWDLTATRSWSLSPQTLRLLDRLDEAGEQVDIVLLFDSQTPGVADLERQVQDVLQEYVAESDRLNVIRIDPTDPADEAGPLALVLTRLRATFADELTAYETALADAAGAIDALTEFARSEAQGLAAVTDRTSAQTEAGLVLRRLRDLLAGMPFDLQQMTEQTSGILNPQEGPTVLPQWTLAAAQYRAALRQPADTLRQAADLFRQYAQADAVARERARAARAAAGGGDDGGGGAAGGANPSADPALLDAAVLEWLDAAGPRYGAMADRLDTAAEGIANLPRLRLEAIVREIRESRSVLLLSDRNAVMLSFTRLFPEPTAAEIASGQRIDRRFAGEQILASGMYELIQAERQVVVFVHAERGPGGIMRGQQGAPDALVAAGLLRDLGFETLTWNLTEEAERPEVNTAGGPAVWVLVPPPAAVGRGGGEAMQAGLQMLAAAEDLLAAGERVMFNLHPSTLPSLGQDDPWMSVLARVGIRPSTGTVIYQQIAGTGGRRESVPVLTLREFNTDHPIGRAVNGLETYIEAPVPLEATAAAAASSTPSGGAGGGPVVNRPPLVVLAAENSATVWAEAEWFAPRQHAPPADAGQGARSGPLPLVMTVERQRPGEDEPQRLMAVGSGNWFYSEILGARQQINQNLFIQFPGNAELFTNGCLWLAGRDDAIAAGSFARSAPRIEGLGEGEALAWRWGLIAIVPALSLVAGACVWMMRRG